MMYLNEVKHKSEMKFLRVLLFVLLFIIVTAVVLGFIGSKDYDVSSVTIIDAPKELVFPYLKSLKRGNDWGPWREEEPDLEISYEGTDGTVGFVAKWDGDKSGKGTQTITAIEDNVSVDTKLNFVTPFGEMESQGYFHIEDIETGSKVTWGFKGTNNFVGRIFSVFANIEKNTAPMFAKGLENLATLVKKDMEQEYNGYRIELQSVPTRKFMVKRAVIAIPDIQNFYTTHLPRIAIATGQAGVEMEGMPCGLFYSYDEEAGITDMAAAIPVNNTFEGQDMQAVEMQGGKALVVDCYGPYDQLSKPHEAIDAYMAKFELSNRPPVIEEYLSDPSVESDPAKWLTRITYLIDL